VVGPENWSTVVVPSDNPNGTVPVPTKKLSASGPNVSVRVPSDTAAGE
jgi:hypothetical protein